jgi:hypothetical protein
LEKGMSFRSHCNEKCCNVAQRVTVSPACNSLYSPSEYPTVLQHQHQ